MLSTILLYSSLGFSLLALVLSVLSFQMTLGLNRNDRDFTNLVLAIAELEDLHEALSASHKRLRSRVGMRELRAKRKNGHDEDDQDDSPPPRPAVDPEQWKREMRLKLHRGEIKTR